MDRISFKGQAIDQIDLRDVPHSGFDRSNHNYLTGKLGAIIPTRLDEVYPGDRIQGKPELVANFEPLAAPLMGSMVLKQEAFFVPFSQVWRHAYKFFTGKNGFDDHFPSISPRDIWKIYCSAFLDKIYKINVSDVDNKFRLVVGGLAAMKSSFTLHVNSPFKDYDEEGLTFYNRIQTIPPYLKIDMLEATYQSRKMMDLVMPIYEHVNKWSKSDYIVEIAKVLDSDDTSESDKLKAIYEFAGSYGDILRDIHQFFFGPSTLFDYLGWPITIPDNFKVYSGDFEITYPDYGIYNVFSYAVFRNINLDGSFDLAAAIEEKFSEIAFMFAPFQAYFLIWYWNYRDQLLETDILDPEEDEFLSSEITANKVLYCTLLRQRCWFKDAYTTALTNTGDGNLLVPIDSTLSSDATYEYYDSAGNLVNTRDYTEALRAGATTFKVTNGSYSYRVPMNYLNGAFQGDYESSSQNDTNFVSLDLFDRIKRLRSVVQKRLITGFEVDDVVWSSFLVRMSNIRIHIPEILGRGRDAVDITTIVNNTSTDQQIAGDKTATAWCRGSISEINYFSEEWGLYLQFATIMPIQTYAGGMQRLYLKKDMFDFMWPEFATMGMDAIYNIELAAAGSHLSDENALKVFGYNGRYYDLKYRQDEEHGRILTDLNYLTFSREFDNANLPLLNYIFVHCWPRLDGFVIDSPLEDVFRADCYTAQGWERRLPVPSQFVH